MKSSSDVKEKELQKTSECDFSVHRYAWEGMKIWPTLDGTERRNIIRAFLSRGRDQKNDRIASKKIGQCHQFFSVHRKGGGRSQKWWLTSENKGKKSSQFSAQAKERWVGVKWSSCIGKERKRMIRLFLSRRRRKGESENDRYGPEKRGRNVVIFDLSRRRRTELKIIQLHRKVIRFFFPGEGEGDQKMTDLRRKRVSSNFKFYK